MLEIYLAFNFYKAFYKIRYYFQSKYKLYIGYFIIVLVNVGMNLRQSNIINIFIAAFLYLLIVLVFFQGKLWDKIIHWLMVFFLAASAEMIFSLLQKLPVDVPVDKAFENGYYNEMIILIRNMLEQALKTNDNLYMAVLTGCLRIARESIFTGLNNFNIFSITDQYFDEYFGFTDKEVKEMLKYYGAPEAFDETKKWYDGYRFGNEDIYCPWDVINHCKALKVDKEAIPQPYWINTSGNYIIKRFIEKANQQTRREIEQLIEGKAINKEIRLELTYNELDNTIENLWSVLFATGYLTQQGKPQGRTYSLTIPNESIRQIFIEQIQEWFKETTRKDENRLKDFCKAFEEGDAQAIEQQFTQYLIKTISIRDTFTSKKENFYHGVLLGLLSYDPDWYITSNTESGDGYSDIMIEVEHKQMGIVIEIKYAENVKALDQACEKALKQIKEKHYDQKLEEEGYETILNYGIACYKKRCKVLLQEKK